MGLRYGERYVCIAYFRQMSSEKAKGEMRDESFLIARVNRYRCTNYLHCARCNMEKLGVPAAS